MAQQIIDLVNNGNATQTLFYPQSVSVAPSASTGFDASNLDDSSLNAILTIGAVGTGTLMNIQVEEASGQTASYTPIAGLVFNQVNTGSANTQYILRGSRAKEWLRGNVTSLSGGATGSGANFNLVVVGQGKYTSVGSSLAPGYDRYPSA